MKKLFLPFGVQDYAEEECYNKNMLEEHLGKEFYLAGFERVETAALEYYDLFDSVIEKNNINRMFKMTDSDGSLLVLRPDITLQICRMAALSAAPKPQKLYYTLNSFEFLPDNTTARTREFAQIGLEILGGTGAGGDIEIVSMAVEALKTAGLNDFLIDIGHMGFFNGLVSASGLSIDAAALLRGSINKKDMVGADIILEQNGIKGAQKDAFIKLPELFGGGEVIDLAKKYAVNYECRAALDNLNKILAAQKALGNEKHIGIDLGMLKGSYYSGLVIKGLAGGLGVSVLDGGRYDNLCAKFGSDLEAVGFAIGTKRLLKAIENVSGLKSLKPCDYAYIILGNAEQTAHDKVKNLKKSGKRVTRLYYDNREQLVDYCRQNKIQSALIFSGAETEEIKTGGNGAC